MNRKIAAALFLALALGLAALILHLSSRTPETEQRIDVENGLFRAFAMQNGGKDLAAFQDYLRSNAVDAVVPLQTLLRADARWRQCKAAPFVLPPRAMWASIVPTLRFIQHELVPVIGPVRVVSGFRSTEANICFRGAKASRHLRFAALDLEPLKPMQRSELVERLCRLHRTKGRANAVGLGVYDELRFHIDTLGFRSWGRDYRGASSPCRT